MLAANRPQRQSPQAFHQTSTAVRAILRSRPQLSHEQKFNTLHFQSTTVRIPNPRNPSELLAYSFDGCYGPTSTQIAIFAGDVVPVLERVLTGYNATIFAYGNTGAGKTFTMEGTLAAPGKQLFIPPTHISQE